MIEIAIPGCRTKNLEHLVLDYNGTIACNGILLEGVKEMLDILSDSLTLHIITADTFGTLDSELSDLDVNIHIIKPGRQDEQKLEFIRELGVPKTVCIGNGYNDHLMLKHAELGIAVILEEGASVQAIMAADAVCTNVIDAMKLLTNTKRLIATLRS